MVALSSREEWSSRSNVGSKPGRRHGNHADVVTKTDSNAALGEVNRRGVGKLRHIHTQEVRLPSALLNLQSGNVADILTNHVNAEVLDKHMTDMASFMGTPTNAHAGTMQLEQLSFQPLSEVDQVRQG